MPAAARARSRPSTRPCGTGASRAWTPGTSPGRLFAAGPAAAPAPAAAITSDRREGFYLWWVFVRDGGRRRAEVLRDLPAA